MLKLTMFLPPLSTWSCGLLSELSLRSGKVEKELPLGGGSIGPQKQGSREAGKQLPQAIARAGGTSMGWNVLVLLESLDRAVQMSPGRQQEPPASNRR